jgi:hypothetical protein
MIVNPATPAVRDLARWLLEHEAAAGKPIEAKTYGACRVCDKLRDPLSTLAGVAGYRSLLSRALTLAKAEVHALDAYRVNAAGHLEVAEGVEPQQGGDETTSGEIILVAQLLGLLLAFIGKSLTLHLVRDVWPNAPFNGTASGAEGKR